ncbi:MAG: hypothetical protein KGZ79_16655 [Dethiobacter sp.]|jgi:hypothetical protein|nr:hypothetical protein [Dethiobacter sp.]
MEWVKLQTSFDSEGKALKAANTAAIIEARLTSQPRGPQYQVETKIKKVDEKWQVFWRKVFIGYEAGCGGGCKACDDKSPQSDKGKVIPFKKL